MIELLEEYERPNNFVYPKSIIKLLELNLQILMSGILWIKKV